jgi:hypothetical protein
MGREILVLSRFMTWFGQLEGYRRFRGKVGVFTKSIGMGWDSPNSLLSYAAFYGMGNIFWVVRLGTKDWNRQCRCLVGLIG